MSAGILILHGLAGTRKEIEPLAEYFAARGYCVSYPALAGHESGTKELARSRYRDWIKTAADAAAELIKSRGGAIVIGFSMGGLIAICLCRLMQIDRIVLINTPIYYWDIPRMIKNLSEDFGFYIKKYLSAGKGKPFRTLLEFLKLLKFAKPMIASAGCPMLVAQTLDDDTVRHKSADYIYRMAAGEKYLKKYGTGGHLLFDGRAPQNVCSDIEAFINGGGPD